MDIQPLEILKWVGLVFAAGFVGYFGRYLSMLIIDRIRRKKAEQASTMQPAKELPPTQDSRAEEARLKLEKKRIKLEKKKAKKWGVGESLVILIQNVLFWWHLTVG